MSAMRFTVMAAERAATMATTIQSSARSNLGAGGQEIVEPPSAAVWRAASRAPTNAKGRAKTECSNLIISSVAPSLVTSLARNMFARRRELGAALPSILIFLGEAELGEDAADELVDGIVEGARAVIEGGNGG